MEQLDHYTESEAKAVLSKHQHKVTRHRVDVLLFMMRHRRAFTFKSLTEEFDDHIDRATVYRILMSFVSHGILNKALNEHGTTCFFYYGHINENDSSGKAYLECMDCNRLFDLPSYSKGFLDALDTYQAVPLNTLLRGRCNRSDCNDGS